ncbi:hypothetical protein [Methanobacterium spitsbergense]|uniref:ASCH domain-containing protein n=1 Tax=Methanobacterium spitsbergense TaxID=2874285 RepID=A0A8T5USV2_9EURY|nr:hypothetical protein [Methanobacterium spitsbergense]MBZ2165217.1 hypothetical protein [Methanobacterium spitsbergense]
MAVLLSIKPKYVDEIKSENKKYEFRKSIFKRNNTSKAYVYSTNPVKKLIGKFSIGKIIEDHPEKLWENFNDYAGINEDEFFDYFSGRNKGFAIEIKEFILFDDPIEPKELIPNFVPPQSFYYIEEDVIEGNCNSKEVQESLDCYSNSK